MSLPWRQHFAGFISSLYRLSQSTDPFIQAKGLLQDLVIVASLVRTLTDSFGLASDLYHKLKRKSSSDDEDDRFHISMLSRKRRDSGLGLWNRDKDPCDSEGELIFTSSAQIRAEYERGYRKIGESFARGDGTSSSLLKAPCINSMKLRPKFNYNHKLYSST
jgi:hypothetical protein